MDVDSLTRAQRGDYDAALRATHRRRVELVILTLDDDPVTSLVNPFLGGSIHGDVDRSPVEVLEARVLDRDGVLDWTNGQHRRFKVRVVDSRFVVALNDWVEATVFTGPLWDFERRGEEVTLVAQGSERLAMGSVRSAFTRPRKAKATEVIRDLLRDAGAPASSLRVPRLNVRLPERVTVVKRGKDRDGDKAGRQGARRRVLRVSRADSPWPRAAKIAEAIDRELFADGSGNFLLRPAQTKPSVSFTSRLLIGPPIERRGKDGEQPNVWMVVGADPKGSRKQIQVEVPLPRRHPLSRQRLAWHDVPREVVERVENEHLKTKKQARLVGERRRDKALRELMEYEVQAFPCVPWLRPNSLVTIPLASGGTARIRVKRWTLPLGPGPDPLVIGANRRSGWR